MFGIIKKEFNDLITWANDLLEPFRNFIAENSRNPFLWVGFVLIGLLVFNLAYHALHKD